MLRYHPQSASMKILHNFRISPEQKLKLPAKLLKTIESLSKFEYSPRETMENITLDFVEMKLDNGQFYEGEINSLG